MTVKKIQRNPGHYLYSGFSSVFFDNLYDLLFVNETIVYLTTKKWYDRLFVHEKNGAIVSFSKKKWYDRVFVEEKMVRSSKKKGYE